MSEQFDKKEHWETIYSTKEHNQVSWFQQTPTISLELIESLGLNKDASIIDVGGGDSILAEHLLKEGYTDITVVDISQHAIDRAKNRIGANASKINWIVSDILDFHPNRIYDLWHDRATFHFLTEENEVNTYRNIVKSAVRMNGHLVIGTFSLNGPTKCSGIPIKQYSQHSLSDVFSENFELISASEVDHPTPFETVQNFIFGTFQRIEISE